MTINGRTVHFLLDREWMNYRYKTLDRSKAESVLFLSKIVDSICPSEGIMVIRLDNTVLGRRGHDWLFLVESEYHHVNVPCDSDCESCTAFDGTGNTVNCWKLIISQWMEEQHGL